ncbi:serine hydrolase domain-containing protein [Nostoc sp. 'Peltigera membranacea cyanobiont' N6]|uniref:serine hydrolase domain-containing protein n=1 Tax=Nostoc sp. 'Peltigera membranacea cyanobiont' N6 TaxID=1261031 RepID=UPI000CF3114F|nr:serine hydrolase domain-containing protein [Nostoc sp. 'Peltigera membranacea cyanobiont' N6]AVH64184.1 beta-lactamase/D-alanyl-D-alanine carboxypeptidase [Nostoc sp. 'Peltigera membranacea cyanobiont' N6]
MNLKFLAFRKILFAIVFVISLGLAGYLVGNNISQKVIEKSFAKQIMSTSTVGKSSQLQTLLNEIVVEEKIPGAVMYISTPKGSWVGASGVNSLSTKTRMKTTDGFSIASMSKTFMAVVVLKLVEQGKIGLDRAIATYLPRDITPHIVNSDKITVRQLLNHTSGVAEYLDTKEFIQATAKRSRSQPWTAREAIPYMYQEEPKANPGEKFIYTDCNYILLELIVENITRGTLAQAIRSQILKPLGLKHTFTELREPTIGEVATGYSDRNKDGKLDSYADVNDGNGLGDGGLVSTAEDLAKFAKALFVKKSLLSSKMMKEMLKFKDNGESYSYGLGVERFSSPMEKAIGHSGIAYGFTTLLAYLPNQNTTIIVLLNAQGVDIKSVARTGIEVVENK